MKARQPRGLRRGGWRDGRVPVTENLQAACPSTSRFLLFASENETLHVGCSAHRPPLKKVSIIISSVKVAVSREAEAAAV